MSLDWSKGLTKETDVRVARRATSLKATLHRKFHLGEEILKQLTKREQWQHISMTEIARNMAAWALAWEGAIGITKHCHSGRHGHPQLRARIEIGNTNLALLGQFQTLTGYGKVDKRSAPKGNRKRQWMWSIPTLHEARSFLIEIQPYLPSKRSQAALLLEFIESRLLSCRTSKKFYSQREWEIYEELSLSNQKGMKNV